MSDTYRDHLLNRVLGGSGRSAVGPVADIAGDAARATAAKIAVALRPTTPSNEQALHGYAQQNALVHGQPYDPSQAARTYAAFTARQLAKTIPPTTPGNEQALHGYAQQTARVHGSPGSGQQADPTDFIATGAVPVTPAYVQAHPVATEAPPPNVPQWQDIKFFEENTQLPTGRLPPTAEEIAAAEAERKAQEETAHDDELKARILQPGTTENSAYQYQLDNGATPDVAMQAVFDFYYTPDRKLPDANLETIAPVLNLIDMPRQQVVSQMGDAAYEVATGKADSWDPGWAALAPGNWMVPGFDATRFNQDFQTWVENPANAQAIRYAYENGFQATPTDPQFTGGQAVWELFINGAGGFYKALADFVNDPTIVVPAGKALGDPLIESAVRAAPDQNVLSVVGRRAAGELLSAPQRVMDVTVDAPFNLAGKWVSSVMNSKRVAGGTLLEEPAVARATEQVNLNAEDLAQQDRIRTEGIGFDPPPEDLGPLDLPPDTLTPPSDMPRYTMTTDGEQWLITDPAGTTVETMPFTPARAGAAEPNYQQRLAQRRVNELNKPIIRAEDEAFGSILPPADELTWTDPAYERLTNHGKNLPKTIQTYVADSNVFPVDVRQQWMQEWTPQAKAHEAVMEEFRAQEIAMLRKTGGLDTEKDLVQKGRELLYPRKTYEMLRFYVDDTLLPFRQAFPGVDPPPRRWITSDLLNPEDANNLIEHAVLGTRDDAIQARKLLRSRNISVEGFKTPTAFVEHLAGMGEQLHGPGWRSTDPSAVKSRGIRARQSAQGPVDASAINEMIGKERASSLRARTEVINSAPPPPGWVRGDLRTMPSVELGRNAAEVDPVEAGLVKQTPPNLAKLPTQIPLDAPESEAVRELSDPTTSSISPGNHRVEATVPGEIRVRPAGAIHTKAVRITKTRTAYDVTARAGERAFAVPTLHDAITVADEVLVRDAKGIDPVPAQVKRVVDDVTGPTGYTYATTDLSKIVTDTTAFQNRKAAFSEQSVQNILSNFDARKFEPIEVRPNPDGTYTVLSGHSRYEAWKRLVVEGRVDASAVPIRIQRGTDEELRLLAQTSNTRGTANTPTEKGQLLRTLQAGGLSWVDAIREVNVNSADGKRLQFLTNLTNGMQDDVDAGRLSVKQGALLGEYIEKGVITTDQADDLFLNGIVKEGMSDAQLRTRLESTAILKANAGTVQGDMFGNFSLLSVAAKDADELLRVQKQLAREESLLTRAAQSTSIDAETQSGLSRAVAKLQAEKTKLLAKINTSLYAIDPRVARTIAAEERTRTGMLKRYGAYEGPGASDAAMLARTDRSYIGAAHQMGKISDATYLNLSKWVEWDNRQMKLWEAYDTALDWMQDPLEAKRLVAQQAIDADLAAEIAAGRLKQDARGTYQRAAHKALSAYQATLQFQREAIMFNWARGFAGAFSDFVGTNYSLVINGEFDAARRNMNPIGAARHFIQDERGKALAIGNLPGMDRYKYLTGTEPPPSVMQLVETRFETGHSGMVLERTGKAYTLLRVLADKDIKALRTGMDRNSRYALHMASFDRNIRQAQNRFRGIVATRAKAAGNDYVDWLKKLDRAGNDFNSDDVLRLFGDERLARDWREMTTAARVDAKKRVDQLLFSYKMTNADNILRNTVFFHYWMTRALPMHAKVAFKNPWLLNAYGRAWEHMQREAEQNGYPPSVRGFLRMQGDNAGFYGLINPIQVLVPFSMLIENNDDPGVFAFIKRWGFFVNPLIEGAAASLGWTSTVPDVTATLSVRRALRYTVNWLNANGHEGLVPNALGDPNTWQPSIVDEATYRIIDGINALAQRAANALAPSQQLIQDFEGSSKNAYEYDVLNAILINELEKSYGPYETWPAESPVWDEFEQARDDIAMGRDGNVTADAVVEIMADAKIGNVIEGAVVPGGIYQRYGPRDTTLAEARAGEQAGYDQRALETTGNAPLTIDLQQLDRLGTENGRQGYKLWNEIAYGEYADSGERDEGIMLNGQFVSAGQINQMSDDQRKRLADAWLAQYEGVPAEVETYRGLRDEFLAANPQAGDFKEYQKGIGNYNEQHGAGSWRTMYAKTDSAFGTAMSTQEANLRGQGKTGDVLANELDRWAMTPEAYNAANGYRDSIYDPPATAKVPEYRFATGGEGTASTPKDPMTKLADEITAYQEKLDTALASMQAAGYSVSAADVYAASPFYATIFDSFGVPNPSSDVMLFIQWSALPENQGKSVNDFIAFLEDLGYKQAA